MKIGDLKDCGIDDWGRPVFKEKGTRNYYCILDGDYGLNDVLEGEAELYYKGRSIDGEPEYPVSLEG